MDKAKPFKIPKRDVWEAFKRVKANQGAAGVDGQSITEFEANLTGNLYKLWNRMSSGSYFPPPVRRVDIPKADGGTRPLGIPTVADRIAQVTDGTFQVKAGSLFPALHRMEQEGWIQGDWVESAEGRRVRSYTLTSGGRRQLAAEKENWTRIVEAMNQVLDSA